LPARQIIKKRPNQNVKKKLKTCFFVLTQGIIVEKKVGGTGSVGRNFGWLIMWTLQSKKILIKKVQNCILMCAFFAKKQKLKKKQNRNTGREL
jgi:hypothetical protein